jgi:hypothetical protein
MVVHIWLWMSFISHFQMTVAVEQMKYMLGTLGAYTHFMEDFIYPILIYQVYNIMTTEKYDSHPNWNIQLFTI